MAIGSNNQYAAGPFQANDLIVNNQAMFSNPGMMALVAKEARKGIGGFFEIPNRERKEAPFLTAAKERVNQELGLSPAVQGGMKNFLGQSETVEDAPKKWQSSPDSPATELAYITDQEKDLLLKANLHNSLGDGMPNQGPSGIISLDGQGIGDEAYDQAVDQSGSEAAIDNYYSSGGDTSNKPNETAQDIINQVAQYQADSGTSVGGDILENQANLQAAAADATNSLYNTGGGGGESKKDADLRLIDEQENEDKIQYEKFKSLTDAQFEALPDEQKSIYDVLDAKYNKAFNDDSFFDTVKDKGTDVLNKLKKKLKGKTIADIDPNSPEGKEIFKLLGNFERFSGSAKESRNELLSNLFGAVTGKDQRFRKDKDGKILYNEDGSKELTLEGLEKALRGIDMGDGTASALESLRKNNPEAYYKAFSGPTTSDSSKSFSNNPLAVKDADGNYKVDGRAISNEDAKRYNNAIFDARSTNRKNDNNNNNQYRGYSGPVVEKDPVVPDSVAAVKTTPTIDPAVGTRPFATPATGGSQYQLPTDYRAALTRDGEYGINTDPKSIAYSGGFNQMEDMDEYLQRIGKKRKNYLDADGNPIMTNATGGL